MIPLSTPHIGGNEWKYVRDCLDTAWVSSAGAYVEKFEERLAEYTSCPYAVATVNGTSALHLALLQAGVEEGEYVLLPDITFVAPANAIRYCGADPLLIDIDPEHWQMDLDLLEHFLIHETDPHPGGGRIYRREGRRIRVLLAVHALGAMADMERMTGLADQFDLHLIEDASEALGSAWNGRSSGSFGSMGVFSFNGNKIVTTGGGGMIVTDDEKLAEQAKHLSTQAKKNPGTYEHDAIGYNYRLVNVLAAIGLAQMEQLDDFLQRKREIDTVYRRALRDIGDIRFQHTADALTPNAWLCTFRSKYKDDLMTALGEEEIECRPLWMPMHQLPMFGEVPYYNENDHASALHEEAVSIPSSVGLTGDQQEQVIRVIHSFFE